MRMHCTRFERSTMWFATESMPNVCTNKSSKVFPMSESSEDYFCPLLIFLSWPVDVSMFLSVLKLEFCAFLCFVFDRFGLDRVDSSDEIRQHN